MRGFSRGPTYQAPVSQVASWSGRLGLFAFAVALLSIIIVRTGFLEIAPALATFAAALMFAALAILLAFAAFVVIWRQGTRGLGRAVGGMLLGVLLLAYPGYLGYRASKLPAINDITTDATNPPRFGVLARLRPRGTSDYPGARVAALQRAAYPDIEALQYDAPAATAYRVALAVVTKRKWNILDTQSPAPGRPGDHRGGGAHADHGFPRRRGGARDAGRQRRAHRRALGLALRHARLRRQCAPGDIAAFRNRRRHGRRAVEAGGARAKGARREARAQEAAGEES